MPGKMVQFRLRESIYESIERRERMTLVRKYFTVARGKGRYVGEEEKKLGKYWGGRRISS